MRVPHPTLVHPVRPSAVYRVLAYDILAMYQNIDANVNVDYCLLRQFWIAG